MDKKMQVRVLLADLQRVWALPLLAIVFVFFLVKLGSVKSDCAHNTDMINGAIQSIHQHAALPGHPDMYKTTAVLEERIKVLSERLSRLEAK